MPRRNGRPSLADPELYELQAAIAKAMGHPTRLRILDVVGQDEVAFSDLAREAGVSKANLSQHLLVLRLNHVVSVRREGRMAFIRLRYPEIKAVCGAMRDALARHLRAEGRRGEALRVGVRRSRNGGRP
jgi:ArsR family transcriptional regulator